tara:strand:- start:922 stop:1758 length:837 start_codon:yes stop_codon:yes gene_type:complete
LTPHLSLNQFIVTYSLQLLNQGISNSKNEIIWYLEYLQICNKKNLYLNDILLTPKLRLVIENFGKQRLEGIPFQYIIKKGTFYGRDFFINSNTLIPRPETESLINCLKKQSFNGALEIGTGSGIISLTLLKEKIIKTAVATDISKSALEVAKKNAINMNISNITFKLHDFLHENITEKYDLVISNPPYISVKEYKQLPASIKNYEPQIALTDNGDGLEFYIRFANILRNILKPNGLFICELGSTETIMAIKKIFKNKKYNIQIFKDMNLDDRVLQITL